MSYYDTVVGENIHSNFQEAVEYIKLQLRLKIYVIL